MSSFEKVQMIVSEIMEVPIEGVNINSQKYDFENWDSLNQLNLVMEIESKFNISLNLDEMAEINSIQDILEIVDKYTSA
ncbi:acyl carrier protein [compost metagenome]